MRRILVWAVVFLVLVVPGVQVAAGGWAAVRLDQPPGLLEAEVPWRFGFMVLQHDVTPNSDVEPVVSAQNIETGEVVMATAVQEGRVGHFGAELTLPSAGDWKWSIAPEPYAATTFAPLHVGSVVSEGKPRVAEVRIGSCRTSFDSGSAPAGDRLATWTMPAPEGGDVSLSAMMADVALRDILDGEHVLAVLEDSTWAALLACGDLVGSIEEQIVVGLRPADGSTTAGIAVLSGDGDQTEIALYLLDVGPALPAEPFVATAIVEIVGGESQSAWFSPVALTVKSGMRVSWENRAASAHMVSGEDIAFEDSGWLEPGASFSQVFTEPGTHRYRCGPHPWMEGSITVEP